MKQEGFLLLPDHLKVRSFDWWCFLQFRDGARSENLSGQVVMWHATDAQRGLPIYQNLGGRTPTLSTRFRHPYIMNHSLIRNSAIQCHAWKYFFLIKECAYIFVILHNDLITLLRIRLSHAFCFWLSYTLYLLRVVVGLSKYSMQSWEPVRNIKNLGLSM